MTFIKWTVPEPDPKLSLRVIDIDINKLNYQDIRFIYSCVMRKHIHEFEVLPGFRNTAEKIIEDEKSNRLMIKNKDCEEGIPPHIKVLRSPMVISSNRKNEIIEKNPVYNTHKTYLETVDKYFPSNGVNSEACSVC